MTQATQSQPTRLQALWQNPVAVKELRSRMRGRRAYLVLTGYLVLMSAFIILVYFAYATAAEQPFGPNPRQAGKTVFGAVVGVQALLVVFIGPSFTAGAITGEKERQTYNLLRTTLLPARSFVTGKLLSALSYVFLLILTAIPLQSIAFILGGVSLTEVVIAEILIVVSAVAFAMIGLYFSAIMRSTLLASVSTFATSLFLTFGLPAMAFIILPFLGIFFTTGVPPLLEVVLLYTALVFAATNLPATIIISEMFLISEDALFFFTNTLSGYTVTFFSPWYVYIILYILLSLLLYALTVRRVRRVPDK